MTELDAKRIALPIPDVPAPGLTAYDAKDPDRKYLGASSAFGVRMMSAWARRLRFCRPPALDRTPHGRRRVVIAGVGPSYVGQGGPRG
jgi:hypothetical protein